MLIFILYSVDGIFLIKSTKITHIPIQSQYVADNKRNTVFLQVIVPLTPTRLINAEQTAQAP